MQARRLSQAPLHVLSEERRIANNVKDIVAGPAAPFFITHSSTHAANTATFERRHVGMTSWRKSTRDLPAGGRMV